MLEGNPARLGPADIALLRPALKGAQSENALIAAIAHEELDLAHELGLPMGRIDRERLSQACQPIAQLPATASAR